MKRRPKYRVKIYDEAHLVDRGSFRLTWTRIVVTSLLFMSLFIFIGIGIVWFSPLKKKLPGYLESEQREKTEEAYLKVDTIGEMLKVHQAYLDNLVKVLDPSREPDTLSSEYKAILLTPDSIMVPSEIEEQFIRMMEEAGYIVETGYPGGEETDSFDARNERL